MIKFDGTYEFQTKPCRSWAFLVMHVLSVMRIQSIVVISDKKQRFNFQIWRLICCYLKIKFQRERLCKFSEIVTKIMKNLFDVRDKTSIIKFKKKKTQNFNEIHSVWTCTSLTYRVSYINHVRWIRYGLSFYCKWGTSKK